MFTFSLICFLFIRFFFMVISKRKANKNGVLVYTKQVSLLFQLILLPFLCFLFFIDKISFQNVLMFSINYFVSDIPEILYQKDLNYLFHHFLAMIIFYCAFLFIPIDLELNILLNLLLMELGSSVLSLSIVSKNKIILRTRPYIFLLSRLMTIPNTYYILRVINIFYLKICFYPVYIILLYHNYSIFNYLLKTRLERKNK